MTGLTYILYELDGKRYQDNEQTYVTKLKLAESKQWRCHAV